MADIPNIVSFLKYNDFDKFLDTVFKPGNGLTMDNYRNNRSRLFLETFSNGKRLLQDSALHAGMSTPCNCWLYNDTLNIKIAIGMFGGMGYNIKLYKDGFSSLALLYIDDVKPFKYKLSDKDFTNQLFLRSIEQTLIVDKKPTFKGGQQLTGYLTFTTPLWYENSWGSNIDTNYARGRIYFTCATK